MVKLIEDETVICDVTQERTHGRRVGWCKDIADALIRAGLARDCPRHSGGRYASVEQARPPIKYQMTYTPGCSLAKVSPTSLSKGTPINADHGA